jgi:hypothetical protein
VLNRADSGPYAVALAVLATLFLLRVVGQVIVVVAAPAFLPSMPHWYSGILPYPLLLPSQIAILLVQAVICLQFTRGAGWAVVPVRPRVGRGLIVFAALYAGGMVLRYVLTMAWHPERRWLGPGTIPSAFHIVLAGFIATVGHYHVTRRMPAA